ncbi:DDE-type integrase/transposase/recombinase [Microvirga sp. SYSU G3D207]|uniref:DDE-type integrase/transposase/recombinase n=1 Tax=Microvirga arsenatis TaxID=2692265 RepID=A0ABW9YW63_9HYPH|nr:DDE-type integrase/transposase/recombinase [Microvirga arsenatis]NBJ24410.1 DDE-type integrase/transposase/recombinase [Microvirga arsenatis]
MGLPRSITAFLVRALRWFRAREIRVERVRTDKGSDYVARRFRKALGRPGFRHIRTRPYTRKPTARPGASSRRFCANGLIRSRSVHHMQMQPTCRGGCPGTISSARMVVAADEHRLRPSPEQPEQNSHLEAVKDLG